MGRGILVTRRGDEVDADFDRHCCDLVRIEPRYFCIHPMAAFAVLAKSRFAIGRARVKASSGPSTPLTASIGGDLRGLSRARGANARAVVVARLGRVAVEPDAADAALHRAGQRGFSPPVHDAYLRSVWSCWSRHA